MSPDGLSPSRRGLLAAGGSILGAGCTGPLTLRESDVVDVPTATPWGGLAGQAYRPDGRPPRRDVDRAWKRGVYGFYRAPATPVAIDGLAYYPSAVALQGVSIETGQVRTAFYEGGFFSPPGFVPKTPYENGSLVVTNATGMRAIDPGGGPPVFGEELMTRWRYPTHSADDEVPVRVNHAPVPLVDGRRAFVTTTGRYPGVIRVDAANGRVRWHFDGSEDHEYHRPAVAGGRVYVVDFHDGVWALDADTGEIDWTTRLQRRGVRPPTVVDGTVYVGSRYGVHAYDAATGSLHWRRSTRTYVAGTALADGTLYYGSVGDEGRIVALDAASGSVRWAAPGPVTGQPVVAGETLLAPQRDRLAAYDAGTGRQLWSQTLGRPMAPPLVARGRVVVAAGIGASGHLYALEGRR